MNFWSKHTQLKKIIVPVVQQELPTKRSRMNPRRSRQRDIKELVQGQMPKPLFFKPYLPPKLSELDVNSNYFALNPDSWPEGGLNSKEFVFGEYEMHELKVPKEMKEKIKPQYLESFEDALKIINKNKSYQMEQKKTAIGIILEYMTHGAVKRQQLGKMPQ